MSGKNDLEGRLKMRYQIVEMTKLVKHGLLLKHGYRMSFHPFYTDQLGTEMNQSIQ